MTTAYQGNMEKTATAKGKDLHMSWKVSYEIGNAIRNKPVVKAIAFLERVTEMKEAVPYKRYNFDVGHKPGKIAAGRYPLKAANYFLAVIKNAVSNAVNKGLNEEDLVLVHVATGKGSSSWHHGRQRRRKVKLTNLDVVVKEVSAPKKAATKAAPKKEVVKEAPKKEAPKAEAKEAPAKAAPAKEEVKAEAKVEEVKEAPAKEEPKAEEAPKVEAKE